VLQKPGKPLATYRTPISYRPIALLSIIRKVIEAIVVKKVIKVAEVNNLLPKE
jgi:hypothetical protein